MVDQVKRSVTIENLFNKTIAIDAFNSIYQFLSIIKGKDGKPLKDYRGRITSHLSGLLYRNLIFLEKSIKPIYCFDGINKSEKIRWSKPTKNKVKINEYILSESKLLLDALGIPWIQAPAEGEAQCCYLVQQGDAWAVASQDYDCFAFGGVRLIRNFAVHRKRKKGNTQTEYDIEFISLEKLLNHCGITREQLVDISILVGNDFFEGFKGFGEKKALKIIKEYGLIDDITNVKLTKRDGYYWIDSDDFYETIDENREIFLNPVVDKDYRINFKKPNYTKLHELLVREHNFSDRRIDSVISRLKKLNENSKKQINLAKFLKSE